MADPAAVSANGIGNAARRPKSMHFSAQPLTARVATGELLLELM
jgi:hypothetical protein